MTVREHLDHRRELGRWGEAAAAEHLRRAGYTIVDRNVRSRYGEIDIVAKDGSCLVFVEVRTRQSRAFTPEESVTAAKRRRLAGLGARYLQDHDLGSAEWRADVVAIERGPGGELLRLEHYVSAVEEPE